MKGLHVIAPTLNKDGTENILHSDRNSSGWTTWAQCRLCGKPIKNTGAMWFHDPAPTVEASRHAV